jgi:hypothetical protein
VDRLQVGRSASLECYQKNDRKEVNPQHKKTSQHLLPSLKMDPQTTPVLFSPFSSKARRLASHRDQILQNDTKALFGFRHCRSVSVLLHIGIYSTQDVDDIPDDDGYGPILFPLKDGDRREIVLVNPHAFENGESSSNRGERKKIVGKVTVETARLVAEVVSSTDFLYML